MLHIRKQVRPLVAVIIRGTDSVEWYGNMDVTGTTYDEDMVDHYSFRAAANDLLNNETRGLEHYVYANNIVNPFYLVTGHSRGAAVANLVSNI